MLDQLYEDAADRPRVDERHPVATGAVSRDFVDEFDPRLAKPLQIGDDVLAAVGDVVQTRASSLEEASDRGVGPEGLEEFDRADEGDADTLSFEDFGRGTGLAR